MLFNLIVVLIYVIFYINFFLFITFIPSLIIYFINPSKSIGYFVLVKNTLINSIGFVCKILLYPNIYIDGNKIIDSLISNGCSHNPNNIGKQKIIISNHSTELDFLLNSVFLSNTNLNSINTLMAKKIVMYQMPTWGFFGVLGGDIFLHRDIKYDISKLNKKKNFNLLYMYPEGTCFNQQRKLISDNYCDKNNLIKFKYHLYPRITGIELIANSNKNIRYIYDLTLIYDEIMKDKYKSHYNIKNYLLNKAKFPNKIFIRTSKHKIPANSFDRKLIENIYLEKDDFVDKFDLVSNNFIPLKYNYLKGGGCFMFVNLICGISAYLFFKFSLIRYLYLIELILCYLGFYLLV